MQKTSRIQISCTQSLSVITHNYIANHKIKVKNKIKKKIQKSKKKNQKAFRYGENVETP